MESRSLSQFPSPHVAVDLVLMTLSPTTDTFDPTSSGSGRAPRLALSVVVLPGPDGWPALPGRFVRERETVEQTVAAVLVDKLGLEGLDLRLRDLGVYDSPGRDPRAWTMSVAHAAGLPRSVSDSFTPSATLLPLSGPAERGDQVTDQPLAYDHDAMVTTALRRMRRRYERSPDPDGLLTAPFTMTQLREAHEAVLDSRLKRDTFARRMRDLLQPAIGENGLELSTSAQVGRPAQLFVRLDTSRTEAFALPRHEAGRRGPVRRE